MQNPTEALAAIAENIADHLAEARSIMPATEIAADPALQSDIAAEAAIRSLLAEHAEALSIHSS